MNTWRGKAIKRNVGLVMVVLLSSLVLSACLFNEPPKPMLRDVKIEWDYIPRLVGRVVNNGGKADYLEIGVKVTPPNDPNTIWAVGWTNFTNFSSGENRGLNVPLIGDIPANTEIRWHWRWSTEPLKARY